MYHDSNRFIGNDSLLKEIFEEYTISEFKTILEFLPKEIALQEHLRTSVQLLLKMIKTDPNF